MIFDVKARKEDGGGAMPSLHVNFVESHFEYLYLIKLTLIKSDSNKKKYFTEL